MYPPDYEVMFRLWHPAMPAADIVRVLRVTPEWGWTRGEQRRTPKGRVLDGGRKDTYLTMALKNSKRHGPAQAVELHSNRLLAHRAFLRRFVKSGGRT